MELNRTNMGENNAKEVSMNEEPRTSLADTPDEASSILISLYDFLHGLNSQKHLYIWMYHVYFLLSNACYMFVIMLETADGPNFYINRLNDSLYKQLPTFTSYRYSILSIILIYILYNLALTPAFSLSLFLSLSLKYQRLKVIFNHSVADSLRGTFFCLCPRRGLRFAAKRVQKIVYAVYFQAQ